jgi:hypothetical protein
VAANFCPVTASWSTIKSPRLLSNE